MGKQIYFNTHMLTDTCKGVSSHFFFARVNSYFTNYKECWLGNAQVTVYICIYIYIYIGNSSKTKNFPQTNANLFSILDNVSV